MATISDDNVVISVEVDSRDAEGKLKVIDSTIKEIGNNSEGAFSKTQASLVTLSSVVQLTQVAISALSTGVGTLIGSLDQAGKVEALSRSFDSLQESVGNNADQSLQKFRQTTQGLVSDLDLFTVANKAVLLNLPTEGFQEASASAIKLGKAMGIDAKQAIDDFTTGVGRGSVMILDNLGIIVNSEKAYNDYAESIGKTATALTDAEKKFAFATEAYKQITEASKNTAEVTLNASDRFSQLQVTLGNLGTELLIGLANNKELAQSLSELNTVIQSVDVTKLVNGLTSIINVASELISIMVQVGSVISDIPGFISETTASLKQGGQGFQQIKKDAEAFEKVADSIPAQLQTLNKGIANIKTTGDLTKLTADWVRFKNTIDSNSISSEKYGELAEKLKVKLQDVDKSTLSVTKATKDNASVVTGAYTPATNKATESTRQLNTELTEEAKLQKEVLEGFENLENIEINPQVQTEFIDTLASDFESSLASALGDALTTAFEGGNSEDFKSIAGDLGGQAGGALGEKMAESTFEVFRATLKGNRSDIQKALDDDFIKYGFGFGGFGLNTLVSSLIGGKDAEANARRAITNTINDAIKSARNDFGINLSSFYLEGGRDAFNPFVNEAGQITTAVGEQFELLSGDIQQTFANLAPALQSVFGLDALNLGQITEMFAVNFGGLTNNLNDLQLLFQSMGLSIEQIEEQLQNAFLTGDLTAEAFTSSLGQTRDLFAQGIPNAIGATDLAFQNLVSGGLQSGRQAFDALGDIASEAGEKGITTFTALRSDLLASGKSVSEVDKLLQALANNGIDSIEELKNISVEQTAGVVSSLNNMAFGFEAITADVKNLADEVEKIKSKKVDIEFNVKTNYDGNTQALLNNTTTGQYIPQIGNA